MTDWRQGDFSISTDTRYLDLVMMQRFLSEDAYWALGRSAEEVRRSIDNSAACFGVYAGDLTDAARRQVGFARLVSDMTTFAWLCDVFVLPEARGQGLAKWLMDVVVETVRAAGIRRVLLATRDGHALYARYGFQQLAEPKRWMMRLQD
jgi:GNAT superfamily N-acetyltransferase